MTMMKPDERRAMRRQQIEQFLASDTGVMEWTKLNRMSTSTFYLWLHRFQDEDPETFGRREPKGGGWIELSRAELRDSVALAKADDPAPAAPVVAAAAPIPAPTPTIAPPHVPHPGQRLALRVGHEVVRVQLHDVGLEEPPRLPGAGAAHHEHVPVALEASVVVGPVHRHPKVLREDDVSVGVLEVHESPALTDGAPAGAAVLLALSLRASVRERPCPGAPHGAGGHEPRRERGSLEREGAVA